MKVKQPPSFAIVARSITLPRKRAWRRHWLWRRLRTVLLHCVDGLDVFMCKFSTLWDGTETIKARIGKDSLEQGLKEFIISSKWANEWLLRTMVTASWVFASASMLDHWRQCCLVGKIQGCSSFVFCKLEPAAEASKRNWWSTKNWWSTSSSIDLFQKPSQFFRKIWGKRKRCQVYGSNLENLSIIGVGDDTQQVWLVGLRSWFL